MLVDINIRLRITTLIYNLLLLLIIKAKKMFNRKKNEKESEITQEDIYYLLSLIAEKNGIDFSENVEEETTEEVEENAIVDTDKFFEEEKKEGDHDESIIENEDVDKNHLEDEIVAIALKPDESFKGGKEEKDATLRKLLTKGLYSPSTASEKDNSCKKNEEEDKEEEEEQRETGEEELKKDVEKRPVFNSIMQSLKKPIKNDVYLTRNERIANNNKKYSINK